MKNKIFGIRLHEARLMTGWSMEQLSEKTGRKIAKQSISKYENYQMMPRQGTIAALSAALDISPEYFEGSNIRIDMPMLRNTLNTTLSPTDSARLEAMLSFWAEQYIKAEEKTNMKTPFINPLKDILAEDISDVSTAASLLRTAWHCGDGPIPSLLRLMERKGIKILDKKLPGGVLGLSTWADDRYPLVAIDMSHEKHTPERLRFTAAHELGHLVLNIPQDTDDAKREKLCNMFAGCFILPKDTLIEELGGSHRDSLTLEELVDLHEVYGVSIAALVHEAWDFGIIPREHYDWWYNERIKKNRKEIGWGAYLYPETIGREKRVKSNIRKH